MADHDSIDIYYMCDVPQGVEWMWFGTEMLVVEARLDDAGRRAAIDEAFADARRRALGPPDILAA